MSSLVGIYSIHYSIPIVISYLDNYIKFIHLLFNYLVDNKNLLFHTLLFQATTNSLFTVLYIQCIQKLLDELSTLPNLYRPLSSVIDYDYTFDEFILQSLSDISFLFKANQSCPFDLTPFRNNVIPLYQTCSRSWGTHSLCSQCIIKLVTSISRIITTYTIFASYETPSPFPSLLSFHPPTYYLSTTAIIFSLISPMQDEQTSDTPEYSCPPWVPSSPSLH